MPSAGAVRAATAVATAPAVAAGDARAKQLDEALAYEQSDAASAAAPRAASFAAAAAAGPGWSRRFARRRAATAAALPWISTGSCGSARRDEGRGIERGKLCGSGVERRSVRAREARAARAPRAAFDARIGDQGAWRCACAALAAGQRVSARGRSSATAR